MYMHRYTPATLNISCVCEHSSEIIEFTRIDDKKVLGLYEGRFSLEDLWRKFTQIVLEGLFKAARIE